jgi:hypothetical protein
VDWTEVDRCVRAYAPDADVMVGVGTDDGTQLMASLDFLRGRDIYPF